MSAKQTVLRKDGGWEVTTACGGVVLTSWSLGKPSRAERDAMLRAVCS